MFCNKSLYEVLVLAIFVFLSPDIGNAKCNTRVVMSPSLAPTLSVVNTIGPSESPTRSPSIEPTPIPSSFPSDYPTTSPTSITTSSPTLSPSAIPTFTSTFSPSIEPSSFIVSSTPSFCPTIFISNIPTFEPSTLPTDAPSLLAPSEEITGTPSISPTVSPSSSPTLMPPTAITDTPSVSPSNLASSFSPSAIMSSVTTEVPSDAPTTAPSEFPTMVPTTSPSALPTELPTESPSERPSELPTLSPTLSPTSLPTEEPTIFTTVSPTEEPTTVIETLPPIVSDFPTMVPSTSPTQLVPNQNTSTNLPTIEPTIAVTDGPTTLPTTLVVTESPTLIPSTSPVAVVTGAPSDASSVSPTPLPSIVTPTIQPTVSEYPSIFPSETPSCYPTMRPTISPTIMGTTTPAPTTSTTIEIVSASPTQLPAYPTETPTELPSEVPVSITTSMPTLATPYPSISPTAFPTTALPTAPLNTEVVMTVAQIVSLNEVLTPSSEVNMAFSSSIAASVQYLTSDAVVVDSVANSSSSQISALIMHHPNPTILRHLRVRTKLETLQYVKFVYTIRFYIESLGYSSSTEAVNDVLLQLKASISSGYFAQMLQYYGILYGADSTLLAATVTDISMLYFKVISPDKSANSSKRSAGLPLYGAIILPIGIFIVAAFVVFCCWDVIIRLCKSTLPQSRYKSLFGDSKLTGKLVEEPQVDGESNGFEQQLVNLLLTQEEDLQNGVENVANCEDSHKSETDPINVELDFEAQQQETIIDTTSELLVLSPQLPIDALQLMEPQIEPMSTFSDSNSHSDVVVITSPIIARCQHKDAQICDGVQDRTAMPVMSPANKRLARLKRLKSPLNGHNNKRLSIKDMIDQAKAQAHQHEKMVPEALSTHMEETVQPQE